MLHFRSSLEEKPLVFTCLGLSFHLLHRQAGADVVALWLICGRPGNVTCMVDTMVIFNQLQMFPVKPAKLFCTARLRCKVRPHCIFSLKRVCLFLSNDGNSNDSQS